MKYIKTQAMALCLMTPSSHSFADDADPVPKELQEVKARALEGNKDAQIQLGDFFINGRDSDIPYSTPEKPAEAIKWYEMAAKQGDLAMQFNVGFLATIYGLTEKEYTVLETGYLWLAVSDHRNFAKAKELYSHAAKALEVNRPDDYAAIKHKAQEYIELYAMPYIEDKTEQESVE